MSDTRQTVDPFVAGADDLVLRKIAQAGLSGLSGMINGTPGDAAPTPAPEPAKRGPAVANADGTQDTDLPMFTGRVRIDEIGHGRTRMSIESVFPSTEAMEQVLAMGMEEGLTQAVGQIDAILAGDAVAQRSAPDR